MADTTNIVYAPMDIKLLHSMLNVWCLSVLVVAIPNWSKKSTSAKTAEQVKGVQGSGGFPTIKLKQPTKPDTLYHHVLIIDLEATCEEGWRFNFPHEIIAFLHFWLIYAEENVWQFSTHFSDQ